MTEPIDRTQPIDITLSLEEWETILGQAAFELNERGTRLRRKWDFTEYRRMVSRARRSARRQIVAALTGKET